MLTACSAIASSSPWWKCESLPTAHATFACQPSTILIGQSSFMQALKCVADSCQSSPPAPLSLDWLNGAGGNG